MSNNDTTIPSAPDQSNRPSMPPAAPSSQMLLPDILGKLRLVPNRPLIKLPADDYPNPFQMPTTITTTNDQRHPQSATTAADTLRDQLFGPKCCGCPTTARKVRTTEHTILNPKQFKQRSSANGSSSSCGTSHDRRRLVLRQPKLRLLEQCMQHGLTKSCANIAERSESPVASAAAVASSEPNSTALPLAAMSQRRSVQERLLRGSKNWNLLDDSFADFRSLVAGCENLSLSMGSVSDEHRSRAFRQLQQQHPHTSHTRASVSRLNRSLKTARSRSEERVYSSSATAPLPSSAHHQPSLSSTSSTSSTSPSVASCSQQALRHHATAATTGTSATTTAAVCDVTIDELACYFETFVHIPKKMSTMAEMMYI